MRTLSRIGATAAAAMVVLAAPTWAGQPEPPAPPPPPSRAPARSNVTPLPAFYNFDDSTQRWANQSPLSDQSISEWTQTCGRTGGGIHMKGTGGDPGQLRIWRKVIHSPPGGRELKLSAWAKGAGVDNLVAMCVQARVEGSRELAGFETTQTDTPLKGDFDWTELKISLPVPRRCENIQILLFMVGNGEVWFDDVSVEPGAEAVLIEPGLFEVRAEFKVSTTDAGATEATLLLPVPLVYRDQAPVTLELGVEPPSRLADATLREDKPGNWVIELKLKDLTTALETTVRWSSVVLVGPMSNPAAGVPKNVAFPSEWPEEAAPWLAPTRSAQSGDESIREIAAEIRAGTDNLMMVIDRTLARTREIYAAQTSHCMELDAVSALTLRGSCTSCANLVAALIRANGIPARILAGYPAWSGPLQTHYIVEAYVPGYGWHSIESTMLRAPWPNYEQVNVAIIPREYEDRSAMRPAAAGGVPYLSLTEHVPSDAPVRTWGTLGVQGQGCDHECRAVRNYPESMSQEAWAELLEAARDRWHKRLGQGLDPTKQGDGERVQRMDPAGLLDALRRE